MKHDLPCNEVFELELRTSHMIISKLDTFRDRIHTLSPQSHHYDQSNHRTDGALSDYRIMPVRSIMTWLITINIC